MTNVRKDSKGAVNTATNDHNTPTLNRDAMRRWMELMWGSEDAGQVSVCFSRSGRFSSEMLPVGERDRVVRAVEKHGRGGDVWCGLSVVDDGVTKGRGASDDMIFLRVLALDIDVAGPGHKGGDLPDRAGAERLIGYIRKVLPIHLVVDSGWGVHGYVAVEPFDPRSDAGVRLNTAWKSFVERAGDIVDARADRAVSGDRARIMRVPGSLNWKLPGEPREVTILEDTGGCITPAEALEALEAWHTEHPPVREPRGRSGRFKSKSGGNTPSERMLAHIDPTNILIEVLDWEDVGGGRLKSPQGTSATSGEVVEEDGRYTLFINSSSTYAAWGLEHMAGPSGSVAVGTDTVLQDGILGGDRDGAKAVARVFADDPEELLDWLVEHRDDYAAAIAELMVTDAPVEVSDWAAASAAQAGGEFWVDRHGGVGAFGICGGTRHGLWQRVPNPVEGSTPHIDKNLTTWFAVRTARTASSAAPQDRTRWGFDVTVFARGYTPQIVEDMTAAESLNPRKIVEACPGLPLVLPPTRTPAWTALEACLSAVGVGDRMTRLLHPHTGWVQTEAGAVFAAPAGSICADGVVAAEVTQIDGAAVDPGSEMAAVGFPALPSDVDAAADALQALLDVVPDRPEVGVALAGAVFAPLTNAPEGCAVVLTGAPDTGKSKLLKLANAFVSTEYEMALVDVRQSSPKGAKNVAGWAQNLCIGFDDFRYSPSDPRPKAVYDVGVQMPYGGVGEAKGTASGGTARRVIPHCCVVVSAEFTTQEAALESRAVIVDLVRGDVDTSQGGSLDAFQARFVGTGLTTALSAHILRWLAHQVDHGGQWAPQGGLKSLRQHARDVKRACMTKHIADARAAETTATLMLGWTLIFDWAEAHGLTHRLPSWELVEDAIARLRTSARSHAKRTENGPTIMKAVIQALDGKSAYLTASDGGIPMKYERLCGWYWVEGAERYDHTHGDALGWLSPDGQYIVLYPAALEALVKKLQLPVAQPAIHGAMKPMLASIVNTSSGSPYARGLTPKAPRSTRTDGRQVRGWVIEAEKIFGAGHPDGS